MKTKNGGRPRAREQERQDHVLHVRISERLIARLERAATLRTRKARGRKHRASDLLREAIEKMPV